MQSKKHKKLPFLAFLIWFLIQLVKSKMADKMVIIVADVTGPQQRYHP